MEVCDGQHEYCRTKRRPPFSRTTGRVACDATSDPLICF